MFLLQLTGCKQMNPTLDPDPAKNNKPTWPVTIEFKYDVTKMQNKDKMPVSVVTTVQKRSPQVNVEPYSSGVISIEDKDKYFYHNMEVNQSNNIPLMLKASSDGSGELAVKVTVSDDNGKELYWVKSTLYVLVTEDEVLSGMNGVYALKLEYLEKLKAAGKLTQSEYEEKKKELKNQGVKIDHKIIRP